MKQKPREIIIRPVMNGFVVNVGCQTLVFDSRAELIKQLSTYLENPEQTEKSFFAKAEYNTMDGPAVQPPTCDTYRQPEAIAPQGQCEAAVPSRR